MSRKPGYYLHLASIPQLIIDSASAVMNSKNRLPFPQCHVLLNVSHLFTTTALGGRKRMWGGGPGTHPHYSVLLFALLSRHCPVFKKEELKGMPCFFSLPS